MDRLGQLLTGIRKKLGSSHALDLSIPVNPVPASRPRVTRWRTYYGKTYTAFRDEAKRHLDHLRHTPSRPFSGPLAVVTEFIRKRPKSTKRDYPHGDTDNYEKAAWDAITNCKRIWDDDDQIVFNATLKRFAKRHEQPGIKLTIYELEKPK